MRELPYFHHGPTSSFLHSQPIQTPPSGPGLVCAAGQVFIWDDPSVTPLSWSFAKGVPLFDPQCGTSTLAMVWMYRVILLEAAVCVVGNLSAYVGRGYPSQCINAWYWGDYSTLYHSERYQHAQYVWYDPTKNRQIQLSNSKAPMRLFVW